MLFWFFAAFKSDDELFHVEMYQWLLTEKQYERLLAVRSPYLEDFLTRGELLLYFRLQIIVVTPLFMQGPTWHAVSCIYLMCFFDV